MELLKEELIELQERLIDIKNDCDAIKDDINNFVIEQDDFDFEFDEYLNSKYGSIEIEGFSFTPADVLRAVDEEKYEEGLISYVKKKDLDSISDYAELKAELKDLEDEAEEIRVKIKDVTFEIVSKEDEMHFEE